MSDPTNKTTEAEPIKAWVMTLRFDGTRADAETAFDAACELIVGTVGGLREDIDA